MSLFKNRFNVLLEQDDEEIKPPVDAEQDALQDEVEPGVEPEQFGANVQPGEDIEGLKQASLASQKEDLKTWIQQIEEFIEYLNGVNGDSIQAKLHNTSCDTLFEKIASSEHKRLARVAVELSALAEAFKGYLIAGD